MKVLINMVNKLNAYLEGRGHVFWGVAVVTVILAVTVGLILIGGFHLLGMLCLFEIIVLSIYILTGSIKITMEK